MTLLLKNTLIELLEGSRCLTGGLQSSQPAGRIKTLAVTKQTRGSAGIGRNGHTGHAGSSDKVRHAPPQLI